MVYGIKYYKKTDTTIIVNVNEDEFIVAIAKENTQMVCYTCNNINALLKLLNELMS